MHSGDAWWWWAALRRGWWVGVLVATLVVLGAGAQYVGALRAAPYVATQTLQIILLEPSTASTSQVAAARVNAESIARLLSSNGLITAPDLDAAIAARMYADDPSRSSVTLAAVAAGLTATHDGATLTLRARWSSADGAEALLRAAVETISGDALAREPAVMTLVPPGVVLQVQAAEVPPVTAVGRDGGALAAARGDLLARIGLGVLAGLLAALGGGMLLARRQSAAVSTARAPG